MCPCPVTDWPQAPAGLGFGVAGLRPCVPARAPAGHRWPQSPAGLSVAGLRLDRAGQRLASSAGRAIGVRGAFAGWVGRGRAGVPPHKLPGAGSVASRRPSTAVCSGGTPARPRPSVSSASSRRWEEDKAVAHRSLWRPEATTVVTVERPCIGDGPSPLRRLAAYETVGWGRVGVPPQQTAHTAVLKRLTPHLAVCEEVPRRGPAPPPHRRNRDPHSPAGV
ncbi:hypothetical protein C0Q66_08495 [Streptomyces albidoflavus]|nr:hypothetical protein C0Q66_08495 [Streptomyces albidoflavus]